MSTHDPAARRSTVPIVPAAWATTRGSSPVPARPDERKVAIYARYSTAGQKETSIERQVEICNEYAKHTGRMVCQVYADRARGGSHTVGRDGLEAMIRDAKAGLFGILVIENVDRLARDLGIASNVFKALLRHHVAVHVPGRGALSLTDVAVQALMGDEGRRILAERTRFAIKEMAREGRFPSGACFGYRGVPGKPGICVIDPEAANVVRRVFALRADGLPLRTISGLLHAEGIKSYRGGRITMQGVQSMLRNARYIGLLIHNRHALVRDPDTNRAKVHVRPQSEWIVTEVPDARIVDQETWDRVRAIHEARARSGLQPREERASYLLSGRIACPACGRWLNAGNNGIHKYWKCTDAYVYGTCSHKRTYSVPGLDSLVLGLLAEELSGPGYAEAYVDAYNDELLRANASHAQVRSTLQRRVTELTGKLNRSMDREFGGGIVNARVLAWRQQVEAELQEAELRLAALPAKPRLLGVDPTRMGTLREAVQYLSGRETFRPRDEAGQRVAAAIRDVVRRIDVKPGKRGRFEATVTLGLGPLIGLGDDNEQATWSVTKSCLRTYSGYHVHRGGVEHDDAEWEPLSDRDWEAVRHLLPAVAWTRYRKPGIDPRPVLDATLRVILTGIAWLALPPEIGSHQKARYDGARILRSAEWDALAAGLAACNPERFENLPEMSRPFVEWSWVLDKRNRRPSAASVDRTST